MGNECTLERKMLIMKSYSHEGHTETYFKRAFKEASSKHMLLRNLIFSDKK